jgi:glycerol-3-phosphate dehydrogenase
MGTLSALAGAEFDAAIVGGGIIGCGVARDLALRGLSVALIDKGDFGGATTAGSTRLIHGGLRYLEMLDFGLVRMDLREREILLRNAPHLVKPLEFRIPFVGHSWMFQQKIRAGLCLYDLLSYDKSVPNHRFVSAAETLRDEPSLQRAGCTGSASYYDAQVCLPERLALENVIDAERHGAVVRNYAEVMGVARVHGKITALRVRDVDTGEEAEVRAKVFVNAAGPWFDRLSERLGAAESRRIRTTKGIHIACAPMVQKANVLFSPVDGRLFFVIPLLGTTWISTTDTDYRDDPGEVRANDEDIDYLLRSVEPFFPDVRRLAIYSTSAGVRALVKQEGSESSVSRLHKVEETEPGVVSVLGGKITGYRAIAEDAADLVCRLLGVRVRCSTASAALPGTGASDSIYGSRRKGVDALAGEFGAIGGEAVFAAREEYLRHLDDYLMRRAPHAFAADFGASVAAEAMGALSKELGWDARRQELEWARVGAAAARASVKSYPGIVPSL